MIYFYIHKNKGFVVNESQEKAIESLRSGNTKLAGIIKDATMNAVVKATELIGESDNARDLKNCIDVIESATKIVGLSPKEAQTNIQINAINGFEFVEIDAEDIKQLQTIEVFDEN